MSGSYRVTYEHAERFIKDQDLFAVDLLQYIQQTNQEQYKMVVHSTALLFAEGVNGLSSIVVERDATNEPTDSLPPVLPHNLVKLRPFDFSQLVALHNDRLKVSFTDEEVICITMN